MNKLKRVKDEILKDHERHEYRDGRLSLTDKYDTENYAEYKAAVAELNEDTKFPYTVYIMNVNGAVKIQYSRLGAKFYEYKKPAEVVAVLERLTRHIERLDDERGVAHSTYAKQGQDGLNILIESVDVQEFLQINITNTFKLD